MTDPQAQLVQLTINRDGVPAVEHLFLVEQLGEVAGYVRDAVARFYQDHPEATLDSGITLTIARGKIPEVAPDTGIAPKYFDGAAINERLQGILNWKPDDP
jgi:hypothetical protein